MTKDRTQPKYRYIWLGNDGNWYGTDAADDLDDVDSSIIDTIKGEDYETGESLIHYVPWEEEEEEEGEGEE